MSQETLRTESNLYLNWNSKQIIVIRFPKFWGVSCTVCVGISVFEQCVCVVYVYLSCMCLDFVPATEAWTLTIFLLNGQRQRQLWFFIFTPVSVRPFPVSSSSLDAEMGINCSTSPETVDCLYDTVRYAKKQQPEHLSLVVSFNMSFCDLSELNIKMSSLLLSENSTLM